MSSRQKLRPGFTTGTCAQAAAKGAVLMLINKTEVWSVDVETPKGIHLNLEIVGQKIGKDFAQCAVIKDAGDDPDVTDGARICAKVKYSGRKGITVTGGEGVGIVTRPGLALGVGEYAINPTPRKMIVKEVSSCLSDGRLHPFPRARNKGIEVSISVPEGKKIAKRTFNPRLGIMGGISIIGTTGIVEPKSTDAYKKSLSLQIDMAKGAGHKKVILVLGYVGEEFCKERLGSEPDSIIRVGDHVGFMLLECAKKNMEEVLLVGHIGKLVKVANGQLDTNIKFGDGRIDTIVRYCGICGAKKDIMKEISGEVSAEATIDILKRHNLTRVFDMIAGKTAEEMSRFVNGRLKVGCILLSLRGEEISAYPKRRG